MNYYIKNFSILKGEVTIETEEGEFIKIGTKYLDYFVTLTELKNKGYIVTPIEYDIREEGIRCLDGDTNIIIGRSYKELFPETMTGEEIRFKCCEILKVDPIFMTPIKYG